MALTPIVDEVVLPHDFVGVNDVDYSDHDDGQWMLMDVNGRSACW